MIKIGRYVLTPECGAKHDWWHPAHWKGSKKRRRKLGSDGVAYGPIMFFWNWQ